MHSDNNFQIVKRLAELAKNQLVYNALPRPVKEEYVFLSNMFQYGYAHAEQQFNEKFKLCVGNYKHTLEKEGKGFGWFHDADKLIWLRMRMNQFSYIIYGDDFIRDELVFKRELGNDAYRDLIEQIDRTVLMTPEEIKTMHEEMGLMMNDILNEVLENEKKK
jgi:hypothetical protein